MGLKLKTVAVVVLYNPPIFILRRLLDSIREQVDHIIMVDNSTEFAIKKQIAEVLPENGTYIDLNGNRGIAAAQNKGIEIAKRLNSRFVLFLDQDSALPANMVDKLLATYNYLVDNGCKVAAIGPSFLDEKTNELARIIRHDKFKVQRIIPDQSKKFMFADYIISSGSLIPIKVINAVGGMNKQLFIDWVDIEWCLRAKQFGYESYVAPQIIMGHCVGDDFVNVGNTAVNLHTDFRNYFIVRNSVYLTLYSKLPMNFRVVQMGKVPLYVLFYSYHSKNRRHSLALLTKAVIDGVTKNMGKGHFKYRVGI